MYIKRVDFIPYHCGCRQYLMPLSLGQLRDAASITHIVRLVLIPTMHCNTMSTIAADHLS